ncbi:MAG: insulinase family protein [Polyangiaceae bacterium]
MSLRTSWLAGAALLVLLSGSGCAPPRPALPPAPPPKPVAELERWKSPPPLGADRAALDLKHDTTRVALANGLHVTVITRPETTTSSVILWVPEAGDWTMGPVALAADALHAGTKVGSEVMVNPRIDFQPINVATNAAGTAFRWQVLPDATSKAIELLAAFVTRPTFEPAETNLKLHAAVDAIQRFSASAGILDRVAQSALIGELPTPEEDARALIKLKREDLQAIHACSVLPAGAELVVVGPTAANAVQGWARTGFSGWKSTPPAGGCERWKGRGLSLDSETKRLDRVQLAIAYLDEPDPVVSLLLPAPALRDEDYLTYAVLAHALSWRALTQDDTLRHSGATYTISVSVDDDFRSFGLLRMAGLVESSAARGAIRRMVEDTWNLSEQLTEADLDTAKRMMRTAFLSDLAYNTRFAERALWLIRQGKDPGQISAGLDTIAQIDLERGRDVARRWLKDSKPSIMVRSSPQNLTAGLGLTAQLRAITLTRRPQAYKKAGSGGSAH